ncbi:MAG: hypothetical protein LBL79_12635 [Prevotella sp.]|jgi:miniconductance mechanosensitive channel|nr:hypothetical protein [Prevotella sp.]
MDTREIQNEASTITKGIAVWMQDFLAGMGVAEQWIVYTKLIVLLSLVVVIVYILQLSLNKIITFVAHRIANLTKLSFFSYTIKNKLPHYLALIGPYSFIRGTIPVAFYDFKVLIDPIIKLIDIYMVLIIIWIIMYFII